MIRCTVIVRISCDKNDDATLIEKALADGEEIEQTIQAAGFRFTDIELEPCNGLKTFEKEYK